MQVGYCNYENKIWDPFSNGPLPLDTISLSIIYTSNRNDARISSKSLTI